MASPLLQRAMPLVRFGLVGLGATGTYLAVSLLLLRLGVSPVLTNAAAFLVSTLVSYLGHYYFTFRSDKQHRIAGVQFVAVTIALIAATTAIQHMLLRMGIGAEWAALVIALTYPPLSFAANSLLTFARR